MRVAAVTIAVIVAALCPAAVTPGNTGRGAPHPMRDDGCSLFVSIPNPCDPDSFN